MKDRRIYVLQTERERDTERTREVLEKAAQRKIFITVSNYTNIKRTIRADHVARVKYRYAK